MARAPPTVGGPRQEDSHNCSGGRLQRHLSRIARSAVEVLGTSTGRAEELLNGLGPDESIVGRATLADHQILEQLGVVNEDGEWGCAYYLCASAEARAAERLRSAGAKARRTWGCHTVIRPFHISGAVPLGSFYMERELDELYRDALADINAGPIHLHGSRQSGKSSLLIRARVALAASCAVAYVNLASLSIAPYQGEHRIRPATGRAGRGGSQP